VDIKFCIAIPASHKQYVRIGVFSIPLWCSLGTWGSGWIWYFMESNWLAGRISEWFFSRTLAQFSVLQANRLQVDNLASCFIFNFVVPNLFHFQQKGQHGLEVMRRITPGPNTHPKNHVLSRKSHYYIRP